MIATVLVVQIAVPLALLLWLVLAPPGSLSGLAVQVAGTAAFLVALALVAQWAVLPWWLPRLYVALLLAAVLFRVLRGGLTDLPLLPAGAPAWSGLTLSLVLLCVGAWFGAQALAARKLPAVDVVDVANPFGPGRYLVGNGGASELVNAHLKTLDADVERFRAWRGQSRAIDFFGIGPFGVRARGLRPADPAAYAIFGAELRAPCTGRVVAVENGMPDFEVPDMDPVNRLGNHVILRCGAAEIVFAHMRRGSVAVVPGAVVAVGDRLGEVGNSGASTEPHLHIHAQRPAQRGAPPISGEPLALRIDGRFLVRGDRLSVDDP